jgi:hypothetical protein
MMVNQFKRRIGGPGLGFASGGKGEHVYGKVGECSGLKPSEKPTTTLKLIKITPPQPDKLLSKMECLKNLPKHHHKSKFGCLSLTIFGIHSIHFPTSLRIPFLKPNLLQE